MQKKSKDQFNWVFRHRPRFRYELLKLHIFSEEQISSYFDEWNAVGVVDEFSPWQDLLSNTDVLITDSISFLFDFAVTDEPLIHLLSLNQRDVFTDEMDQINSGYYLVYNLEQLQNIFNSLIINSIDLQKTIREKLLLEKHFVYFIVLMKIFIIILMSCLCGNHKFLCAELLQPLLKEIS